MTTVSGEICTVRSGGWGLGWAAVDASRAGAAIKNIVPQPRDGPLRRNAPPGARYNRPMERALLRGATAARFLARYWQQRPLLIRRAVDGFRGILSWRESTALAT